MNIKDACNEIISKIDRKDVAKWGQLKFLKDIKTQTKLTEKQEKWFRALANEYNVSAPEAIERKAKKAIKKRVSNSCEHGDLGSLGYKHGSIVTCPYCGQRAEVW